MHFTLIIITHISFGTDHILIYDFKTFLRINLNRRRGQFYTHPEGIQNEKTPVMVFFVYTVITSWFVTNGSDTTDGCT